MSQAAYKGAGRYTREDFAKLPEGSPCQLIEGDLVMTPSPVPYHQMISKRLLLALHEFAEKDRELGIALAAPIDVHLDDADVFQPDIIFVARERLSIIGEQHIEAAPDLIIEILSPSTAYYDLRQKKGAYARHGVKEYWIVDPIEKSIEVHGNSGHEFALDNKATAQGEVNSRLLEGFSVEVGKIFGNRKE